jgi:spermidine/putrescine transport system substrate-binding protein
VKGQKSSSSSAAGFDWAAQKKTGIVNFTNWPQYIDKGKNGSIPTLDAFEKQTGDKVTYRTDIQDNATYYAQIRPELEAGQDIGSDIIVITNGSELAEMIALNYLIPLDHSLTPNFNKYAGTTVKDPPYDPGNKYTMAWQSGFTGIGYNTKYVKTAPTSFMDLLDPAYKGKVGMMGNNQDLPCFALVATGVDPNASTPAQWQKAADLLQQQKDSGNVRKYYLLTEAVDETVNLSEFLHSRWPQMSPSAQSPLPRHRS